MDANAPLFKRFNCCIINIIQVFRNSATCFQFFHLQQGSTVQRRNHLRIHLSDNDIDALGGWMDAIRQE